MKLVIGAESIQVISSQAPLGKALLGKREGNEVTIEVALAKQAFEVLWVC